MRSNSAVDDVGDGDLIGLRPLHRSSWRFVIADILEIPANTCGTLTNLTKTLARRIENHPQPAGSCFPFLCI